MKSLTLLVLLFMPLLLNAQNTPQFNQQQMQAMMQNAQQMQTCMENIDQSEMQAFEQKAQQIEAEIHAHCSAGERDQALDKAKAFGLEVSSNTAIQEMKKCGEMMQGFMPDLSTMMQQNIEELSERHVCDN